MISDNVRRVAMCHAPHDLAAIQIDCRQRAIRWFHNGQPLNIQARGSPRRSRLRGRIGCCRWRSLVLRSLGSAAISRAAVARAEYNAELFTADSFDVTNIRETGRRSDERSG